MVKIIAFSGSSRSGSYNQTLVTAVAKNINSSAEIKVINLKDYSMPLYSQDAEEHERFGKAALELKALFAESDGFMIASPEYNSSFTPLLKNMIDWVSRPLDENDAACSAFRDKTALLLSASPGALGGMRSLISLRMLLENIGVMVLPSQNALPGAHKAFDESGDFKDAKTAESFTTLGLAFVQFTEKLKK